MTVKNIYVCIKYDISGSFLDLRFYFFQSSKFRYFFGWHVLISLSPFFFSILIFVLYIYIYIYIYMTEKFDD